MFAPQPVHLREEAIRLRIEEKKTSTEICKILGLASATVCRWLKKFPLEKVSSAREAGHRICIDCKQDKPNEEFNKRYGDPQPVCRECQKQRYATYYENNREKVVKAQVQRQALRCASVKEKMVEFLQDKQCLECGEKDIRVLEFHHTDSSSKEAEISTMIGYGFRWEKILSEIEKCIILCANCHRKETVESKNFYKSKQTGV